MFNIRTQQIFHTIHPDLIKIISGENIRCYRTEDFNNENVSNPADGMFNCIAFARFLQPGRSLSGVWTLLSECIEIPEAEPRLPAVFSQVPGDSQASPHMDTNPTLHIDEERENEQ